MEVHPVIVSCVFTLFVGLVGVGWAQVNGRIKKVEQSKVDCKYCDLKENVVLERFKGFDGRFEDMKSVNSRDHEKICENLALQMATLTEVRDCMVKMAADKEC